jgi:hypothetical protein
MKSYLTSAYVFTPGGAGVGTINFTGIRNFNIRKLVAVLNITRNAIIYAPGLANTGLQSLSGSTITLQADTTGHAGADQLMILYEDSINYIPADDQSEEATPVRALPMFVDRMGFSKAITGNVDTDWGTLLVTGAGMTVNQTGGNLVIAAGTTARSETIIRSNRSYEGGIRLRCRSQLSNRIINQEFFVELVDVISDGLAYTITSATTINVTIPNNPFNSGNVGQRMYLGAFAGTGTFLGGRYPIASVVGDVVTFTVSGFAAGSGTVSLFGWNTYRLVYSGTTATNALFDTQRNGYNSGDTTITINSTAAPGHMAVITGNDLQATIADQLVASATAIQQTIRGTRSEMVPDDIPLRLQIRVLNGSTAPASGTTWTIGFVSVSNYANQDVTLQDVRPMSVASALPVEILRAITLAVSGTITASNTAGTAAQGAAASGNPVFVGSPARTAQPTARTDGQMVAPLYDSIGRAIMAPGSHIRQLRDVNPMVTLSTTTETTIVPNIAATFNDLEALIISNTSATPVRVDFRDTTAGTVRFSVMLPANGTVVFVPPAVKQTTLNTNWTAQLSAAVTDVRITALTSRNI